MDDVNINKICIEEEQLDGDEEDWIKLSWISRQSDNDGNFRSSETQGDSDNELVQMKDDNKASLANVEPEDISDGISVITESDTDTVNTNLFRICQFNGKSYKSSQMLAIQKNIWDILIACALGIIIGLALSHLFRISETCPVSSRVDAESFKTASHNIVNTCKELTDVKTILNEIKAHMPTDKKIITEQFLTQFFEITDFSNKTNSKPVTITKEFFNSIPHPLDQLQMSLQVLSSLMFIYDNNSLKNNINKTLDIVNNTKTFYDTLDLFTNNTQDVFYPIVLNYLQHNNDKMYVISKLFLSNLMEKVNKVTSKVYDKYAKERHRLNKKLCHLKSILPDDKLLRQLTENNELFKDYDKSCFSNYTSKNLGDRTAPKGNMKTKNIKEHVTKTDDTILHTKYDKKNTHKIHNNKKKNFLKNERNKKQNVEKSITVKFLQNTSYKLHNTSQLFLSEIVENISKLRHHLNKELHHLKNILSNNNERNSFLKQLFNKKSVKYYEEKNDNLQSNVIPKNSFDNILMQLKNTCPLSTNYCPKFINMSTFDTVPNHKTENYKYKKHDIDSKKTVMDHENSANILPAEGKSKPKKKDYFKSNDSNKKVIDDKANYEEKNISSQNKINDHISEHTVNYYKSKHSSFDSRTMKQDNQHYTDKRSDSKRSYEYKKQRQSDISDWYFRRVRSRRNARRHAEYIYRQLTKWFWKNHR